MVRHLSRHGVGLLDIAYCLHPRSEPCGCRKPATGLADAILSRHPELTLTGAIGTITYNVSLGGRTHTVKVERA